MSLAITIKAAYGMLCIWYLHLDKFVTSHYKNEFMEALTTRMKEGQFIFPNDTEYDLARAFFNRKFDLYQAAILCAKLHALKIAVRSGRPSYEGFSTGKYVLLVDISQIKDQRYIFYKVKVNTFLLGKICSDYIFYRKIFSYFSTFLKIE